MRKSRKLILLRYCFSTSNKARNCFLLQNMSQIHYPQWHTVHRFLSQFECLAWLTDVSTWAALFSEGVTTSSSEIVKAPISCYTGLFLYQCFCRKLLEFYLPTLAFHRCFRNCYLQELNPRHSVGRTLQLPSWRRLSSDANNNSVKQLSYNELLLTVTKNDKTIKENKKIYST